jgi:hypothetical protein
MTNFQMTRFALILSLLFARAANAEAYDIGPIPPEPYVEHTKEEWLEYERDVAKYELRVEREAAAKSVTSIPWKVVAIGLAVVLLIALAIIGSFANTRWFGVLLLALAIPNAASAQSVRSVAGPGLMHGGNHNHALTGAELNHPKVKFIVPRERWSYLEPTRNNYNATYLLREIKRARAVGKPYVLGVMTGSNVPAWVPGDRYKGVIVPWAPALITEYRDLHWYLSNIEVAPGLKLKDDPLLGLVWGHVAVKASQELHTNGMERAPGYSPAKVLTAIKASIDVIAETYPGVACVVSISGQKPVQAYQPAVIAYARQKFGPRATFQHNSLGKQTTVTALHHRTLLDLAKQGVRVGSEAVQPGNVSAITKFPEATYTVWYPGDERGLR